MSWVEVKMSWVVVDGAGRSWLKVDGTEWRWLFLYSPLVHPSEFDVRKFNTI